MRNYRRVIETWWDEYKEYFYVSRPESRTLDYGDLSVQHKFRQDHWNGLNTFENQASITGLFFDFFSPKKPSLFQVVYGRNCLWRCRRVSITTVEQVLGWNTGRSGKPVPWLYGPHSGWLRRDLLLPSSGWKSGKKIKPESRFDNFQLFRLNDANQLMQYDQCLYEQSSGEVHLRHCGAGEYGYWTYEPEFQNYLFVIYFFVDCPFQHKVK